MLVFFFNDTATTEIYTLSLHDALPICRPGSRQVARRARTTTAVAARRRRRSPSRDSGCRRAPAAARRRAAPWTRRSEEHTSELQSRPYLVCRLLLEKKTNQVLYEFSEQ